MMTGSFVQTTFADHIFLNCPRGKETITIPQRPKQMEFYDQQVEGFVENMQRGDAILCYRCQSKIEVDAKKTARPESPTTPSPASAVFRGGGGWGSRSWRRLGRIRHERRLLASVASGVIRAHGPGRQKPEGRRQN